jgi:hypothetical protein
LGGGREKKTNEKKWGEAKGGFHFLLSTPFFSVQKKHRLDDDALSLSRRRHSPSSSLSENEERWIIPVLPPPLLPPPPLNNPAPRSTSARCSRGRRADLDCFSIEAGKKVFFGAAAAAAAGGNSTKEQQHQQQQQHRSAVAFDLAAGLWGNQVFSSFLLSWFAYFFSSLRSARRSPSFCLCFVLYARPCLFNLFF